MLKNPPEASFFQRGELHPVFASEAKQSVHFIVFASHPPQAEARQSHPIYLCESKARSNPPLPLSLRAIRRRRRRGNLTPSIFARAKPEAIRLSPCLCEPSAAGGGAAISPHLSLRVSEP